jgi:AraC-like DNA-binding protein
MNYYAGGIYFLALFSSGIIGLILTCILLFVNREKSLVSDLLAAVVFILSVLVLTNAAYLTEFFLHFPMLWRAMDWITFCIGPVSYLYVRSVLTQSFRLRIRDALFFLPALLFFLHRLPYYFLTHEEKLQVVQNALHDKRLVAAEPEGFLPPGWAAFFRILVGLAFLLAQMCLLWKWKRSHMDENGSIVHNREILRWLIAFTLMLSSSYLLVLAETTLQVFGGFTMGYLIAGTIAFTIIFIAGYLFLRPRILYGMIGWMQEAEPFMTLPAGRGESFSGQTTDRQTLSVSQGQAIRETLEDHFRKNHPFCQLRYTIRDLSKEIRIPSYQLSVFINQEYGKNFNELINEARIDHLKSKLSLDPNATQYTLEALSRQAGFNSRNSFIKAVKRHTGMTPSEFFLKKED